MICLDGGHGMGMKRKMGGFGEERRVLSQKMSINEEVLFAKKH